MHNSADDLNSQLANYGKQIHELLSSARADIRTYKFSVEKTEGGFELDVALRVSFNSRKDPRVSEVDSSQEKTSN